MRRRRLLALCGSLAAGTAGCLQTTDGPADPPENLTVGSSTTPTTAPGTDSTSVEITGAAVQPGVVGPITPDSIGVFDRFGQYLVVEVAGGGPGYDDFELWFDGQRFPPITLQSGLYREDEWGSSTPTAAGRCCSGCPSRATPPTLASSSASERGNRHSG
ncbi:hypothetical protein ACFQL1_04210 [Halomicroarcula sp. GCM10025709]|uniref:hypothetical protein n=1 Tax=Halomicroarcula sp. GCM10025709 TaxID=3252669 RepID=UPI00362423E9